MPLITKEKPITKEQYENAQMHNGRIASEDMNDIFSVSDLCGYGVYNAVAIARYDDESKTMSYIVRYTTSTCCD